VAASGSRPPDRVNGYDGAVGPGSSANVAPASRAIVLAGGAGTRLRPYTAVIPKPLMPVGDRPVLDIVIRQLEHAGFTRVTIATGYLAELVEAFFGDGSDYGVAIDYIREQQPLGTVGALALTEDLDAPFVVMNGDVLTDLDYGALVRRHAASDAIATIAVTKRRIDISLGIIEFDEQETDRLVDYVEKPAISVSASMGVYCFSPRVRDYIDPGERLDFPDLVLRLLEHAEIVRGWEPRAYWLDIGRHEDHERAVRDFERNRSRFLPDEGPTGVTATPRRRPSPRPPVGGTPPMHALVTGGAGFIGSHLVDALLAAGHNVSVIDNLTSGRREQLDQRARLYVTDVSDVDALEPVFAGERPDVVFHLAGQYDVRRSVAAPAFDANVNVRGTAAVLEAARAHGARRVVFASTGGALYGEADLIPTPESAQLAPMSPYGTSKASAETYCGLYTRLYGLSTASLRLANVYGPRQDPRGEAGVVALFCAAALDGTPATVFGDGLQTRDYIYVADVVAAFLAAGAGQASGPFNIGTEIETSVLDLAQRLDLETVYERERIGEVRRSCLDSSAARAQLSWRSTTTLADGLERTLAWARGRLTQSERAQLVYAVGGTLRRSLG
jgi:nucleoside-diphosphate-sugar epimerase/dTDP-glucose pyrophosphorylase